MSGEHGASVPTWPAMIVAEREAVLANLPIVRLDVALALELATLVAHLRRYVRFSKPEQAIAVALWIAHAHARDAVEQSPILAITSPVKQSGKTRLLEVVSTLVPNPWTVERPVTLAPPASDLGNLRGGR
jgi:hypothetical protein